ncbi:hypothetical protein ACSSS7_004366 [Eimeria intestinalis]
MVASIDLSGPISIHTKENERSTSSAVHKTFSLTLSNCPRMPDDSEKLGPEKGLLSLEQSPSRSHGSRSWLCTPTATPAAQRTASEDEFLRDASPRRFLPGPGYKIHVMEQLLVVQLSLCEVHREMVYDWITSTLWAFIGHIVRIMAHLSLLLRSKKTTIVAGMPSKLIIVITLAVGKLVVGHTGTTRYRAELGDLVTERTHGCPLMERDYSVRFPFEVQRYPASDSRSHRGPSAREDAAQFQ